MKQEAQLEAPLENLAKNYPQARGTSRLEIEINPATPKVANLQRIRALLALALQLCRLQLGRQRHPELKRRREENSSMLLQQVMRFQEA
jgi:hypothetical protein